MSFSESFVKKTNKISFAISIISYAAFAFSAVSITADVFMRYFFNRPFSGVIELNTYLMPVMAYMALAYTQFKKQHIRVTIVTKRLDDKYRKYSKVLGYALGLIITLLIGKQGWIYAINAFAKGESTLVGMTTMKTWWARFALPIGMWALSIQFLSDLFDELKNK